jgi:hypothetical protein
VPRSQAAISPSDLDEIEAIFTEDGYPPESMAITYVIAEDVWKAYTASQPSGYPPDAWKATPIACFDFDEGRWVRIPSGA